MDIETQGRLTMRFVFYLMVILLAVVGTTNYWLFQASVERIESSLDHEAEAKLGGMVSLSGYYLTHFENQLLAAMAKDVGGHEGVNYVGISSKDGAFNSHVGRKDGVHTRLYPQDIRVDDKVIGEVVLGLDTSAMEAERTKAGRTSLVLAALSVILLGGMLFFFFRTQVVAAMEQANREKARLQEEQEFFTAVMNTSDHKVLVLDPRGCIILANRSCQEMIGNEGKFIGDPVWQHIDISLGERSLNELCVNSSGALDPYAIQQLTEDKATTFLPRAQEQDAVIEWNFNKLADSAGNLRYIIGAGSDVTEQYHEARRLTHLAHHDALTGLPNRALFADRMKEAAKRHRRDKTPFALLYIDLDKFKPINDTLGHEAGDYVLKLISRRLGDALREVDTVARLGGDEFGVILHNVGNREDACHVTEKLLAAVVPQFMYHSHQLQVGASIGVALYPDDSTDLEQLTKYADSAMYQAKQAGRNTYRVFEVSKHPGVPTHEPASQGFH